MVSGRAVAAPQLCCKPYGGRGRYERISSSKALAQKVAAWGMAVCFMVWGRGEKGRVTLGAMWTVK